MVSLKKLLHTLAVAVAFGAGSLSYAAELEHGHDHAASASGEQCVEPEDVMRRNHMDFIKHQRDETMRNGIRTTKYSLKRCIECHAKEGDDGETLTIKSPDHFCSGCHSYAAVSIDCFQCHASTPGDEAEKPSNSVINRMLKEKLAEGNAHE